MQVCFIHNFLGGTNLFVVRPNDGDTCRSHLVFKLLRSGRSSHNLYLLNPRCNSSCVVLILGAIVSDEIAPEDLCKFLFFKISVLRTILSYALKGIDLNENLMHFLHFFVCVYVNVNGDVIFRNPFYDPSLKLDDSAYSTKSKAKSKLTPVTRGCFRRRDNQG